MAKKVLVKDNKVLSLHSGKVLGAPENYDLDTYLNFYMPFGGTITLRRVGSPTVVELEYSTDGCRTWQIWEEVGTDRTITLPQDGRVWIRNTSETLTGFGKNTVSYYRLTLQTYAFVYGDCRSLVCKSPSNVDIIPSYSMYRLFESASNTFEPGFYNFEIKGDEIDSGGMRRALYNTQVTSVVIYPETLQDYALANAFSGCNSLKKIVTYMKNVGSNALNDWVSGVADNGDFYCDPELTIPTGNNGIPSGWTRHDLSELE